MFRVKHQKNNNQSKDLSHTPEQPKWIVLTFVLALFIGFTRAYAQTDFQLSETNFKIPSGESKLQLPHNQQSDAKHMSADFYLETYNYNSAFDAARLSGNPYQENHLGLNLSYKNLEFKKLTFKSIFQTDLSKTQNSIFDT